MDGLSPAAHLMSGLKWSADFRFKAYSGQNAFKAYSGQNAFKGNPPSAVQTLFILLLFVFFVAGRRSFNERS